MLARGAPSGWGPAAAPREARLRHVPALDGLRGLAVLGVVAYHLGHLRGGYLGVDAFFVLSGFLITSLLAVEWKGTGGVDLRRFWVRRARRLLPALLVVLAAVAGYAATVAGPLELQRIRADGLATLFYVANWHAVAAGTSYWANLTLPSPLLHTWSLAIEEQFYVLWPLVVVAVLGWWRRSLRALLAVTAALAALSAALMPLLFDGGDPSRVYYGTDTRMAGILYGAVLALAVACWGQVRGVLARRALEVTAVVAMVGLGWGWATVRGTSPWLYQGGFVVFGLAVAVVIAAATHDRPGPVARVLSIAPLRWFGLVSYGLYLWHWPVIVWLTPRRTGVDGWELSALRFGVTMAVTLASYWLVEQPIRHGALRGRVALVGTPAAVAAVAVALLAATTGAVAPPAVAAGPTPAAVGGAPGGGGSTVPPPVTTPGLLRVLVVGDSGGFFLGEAMARLQTDLGASVLARGAIGCGIARVSGGARLDDGRMLADPEGCADWPARWAADVASFQPDVSLLVLAWPGYGDREVDGTWQHPCQPGFDQYYRSEVAEAIRVLGSAGGRVVVATAPYFASDAAPADAVKRVDCLNTVYRQAAAADGALVLDLNAYACPDGRCLDTVDGVVLRPDGLHFSGPGAELAARWTVGQLRTLTGVGA